MKKMSSEILQKEITYKEESYSVKNSGEILRHSRLGKRTRKDDEIWTFGTSIDDKGFYNIGTHKVHAIVATAFCGEQQTKQHVIFHKNYNKKDNRAENLLWVTKFQFHVLQPNVRSQLLIISKKKKFEEVLEDFENVKSILPQNLFWMQNISQEEVNRASELYKKLKFEEKYDYTEFKDVKSLNKNAVQRNNWWTKNEFPCCPKDSIKNTLEDYYNNLQENKIFCKNPHYKSKICKFQFNKEKTSIIIKCTDAEKESVKPWKLAEITYENNIYIHKNLGTFFSEDGVDKYYTIALGEEWTGGNVFDDFC